MGFYLDLVPHHRIEPRRPAQSFWDREDIPKIATFVGMAMAIVGLLQQDGLLSPIWRFIWS
jgi:hypothetical protein